MRDDYHKHAWLLNQAKEIVNEHLKGKYERGEISSPYENGSWLDVIQIFDYERNDWEEHTINNELFFLIIKIKIHVEDDFIARSALKFVAQYIINTESIWWWCRQVYWGNLKYVLQRHFPAHKSLNYDYLRFVLNADLDTGTIGKEVVITS